VPVRRVPTQERSRRRFEAILDAAAEVFAETGFDAATMEQIAERADTSVGSIYQFFPNKLALFRAVAERVIETSGETFQDVFAGAAGLHWSELLDRAVDAFARLYEVDAAFRAVWKNFQLYGEYAEADQAAVDEMVEQVSGLVGVWAPEMGGARRRTVAAMLVNGIGIMLLVAMRESKAGRRRLLEETKLMMRRYLEPEVTQ